MAVGQSGFSKYDLSYYRVALGGFQSLEQKPSLEVFGADVSFTVTMCVNLQKIVVNCNELYDEWEDICSSADA